VLVISILLSTGVIMGRNRYQKAHQRQEHKEARFESTALHNTRKIRAEHHLDCVFNHRRKVQSTFTRRCSGSICPDAVKRRRDHGGTVKPRISLRVSYIDRSLWDVENESLVRLAFATVG
jgi:hypothetical protein